MSVAIADLDGERGLDLVVTNAESQTVSVLLGLGDGAFAAHREYMTGPLPTSTAVVDLNQDRHPDLAVVNSAGSSE